eukprot:1805717-Lingulodinium_polyedra.AAC.1
MMRPKRPPAATAARKSHARALHANSCSHGARARATYEPPWRQTVDLATSMCCLGAAWVLLGCGL